jgi:UDP-glucose 4-epimerase
MARSKFSYNLIMRLWKLGHLNLPFLKTKSSEKTTSGHIIPVNQIVNIGRNIVLPMLVLRPLIERASAVAIMNECICRRGENCRAFPHDFGCLLLGGAVRDLPGYLGRTVTPDEAIAHAQRALQIGLVPLVIHDAVDAWMWGLDFSKMMNICFCCNCCCDVRRGVRSRTPGFFENIHRLPGLAVAVNDRCDGCGVCQNACLTGAIEVKAGRAVIGEDCKGCGRCVSACPREALSLILDPQIDTIGLVLEKYDRRTDVGRLSETGEHDL